MCAGVGFYMYHIFLFYFAQDFLVHCPSFLKLHYILLWIRRIIVCVSILMDL